MELGSLHNAAVVYNTEEKKLAVDFGSHSGEDGYGPCRPAYRHLRRELSHELSFPL